MIVDFNKIEETVIPHFKDGEKEVAMKMFFDGNVRILKGRIVPGGSIGMHTHDDSCEVIFATKGSAKVICNGEEFRLNEGDCHYCPKGQTHTMINDTDEIYEFTGIVPKQ